MSACRDRGKAQVRSNYSGFVAASHGFVASMKKPRPGSQGGVLKMRSYLRATIRQAADVCQARGSRPATWRSSLGFL
jgi:hypothetical protein